MVAAALVIVACTRTHHCSRQKIGKGKDLASDDGGYRTKMG